MAPTYAGPDVNGWSPQYVGAPAAICRPCIAEPVRRVIACA